MAFATSLSGIRLSSTLYRLIRFLFCFSVCFWHEAVQRIAAICHLVVDTECTSGGKKKELKKNPNNKKQPASSYSLKPLVQYKAYKMI